MSSDGSEGAQACACRMCENQIRAPASFTHWDSLAATMNRTSTIGTIALLLAAAGAAWWYFVYRQAPVAPAEEPTSVAQAPAPEPPQPPEPAIRHPIGPEPAEPGSVLPALDASDTSIAQALAEVFGTRLFREYFDAHNLIRRIVVTVDNLPRPKLPRLMLPLKPVGGRFLVDGTASEPTIASANAARYAPYVRLAEAVDSAKLVAVYRRLYPLFQKAYVEIGYPDAYFNDRLVEVIDHLLAAPETAEPPLLVRPKIFYEFADPELEARSAGHKLLLRMGSDNAQRIKAKLREVRTLVAVAPSGSQ